MSGRTRLALALAGLFGAAALPSGAAAAAWLPSLELGRGQAPALAGNGLGVHAVAWSTEQTGRVQMRVHSGQGFGPVETVPFDQVPPFGTTLETEVAIDAQGNVYVLGVPSGGGALELQVRSPTGRYLPVSEKIVAAGARQAKLAGAPDGRVVVVWRDGADPPETLACERSPGGSCSAPDVVSTGTRGGLNPNVAIGPGGDAVIWFEWGDALAQTAAAARFPVGGPLSPSQELDTSTGVGQPFTAAVDGAGNAVFAWQDGNPRYNVWPSGAAPLFLVPPDLATGLFAGSPSVVVDAAGNARFAWSEPPMGLPDDAIFTRALPAGGVLGATTILARVPEEPLANPVLAANPSGTVLGLWSRGGTIQGVEGRLFPAAGAPLPARPLSGQPATGAGEPAGFVDPGGGAVATWSRTLDGRRIESAAYDVRPPSLAPPVIPAVGERAEPETLLAFAPDDWGPVTLRWDFGDGSTGEGGGPIHSWSEPGSYAVTVTARDAAGNQSVATRRLTVSDSRSPRLTRVSMLRKRFRRGKPRIRSSARAKRGSAFRFTLSERASVRVGIARRTNGRRVRGRCRKGRPQTRRKRCIRFVKVGAVRFRAEAGRTSEPFRGKTRRRALRPAAYRATLVATDPYGNRGRSARVRFRIVRSR